jgi:hypothetical protein
MVPSLVSNYRENIGSQHKLSSFTWQTDLRIPPRYQFSKAIEPLDFKDDLWPGDYVHAGGQEIKAQAEGHLSIFRLAKMRFAFCILIVNLVTSIYGVSSCHSGPM